MSSGSFEMIVDDPHFARIAHLLEEGVDEERDELLFYYNYLTYEFDHPLGLIRARSYLHEIQVVSVFGLAEGVDVEVEYAEILRWLRRRFVRLKRLGDEGYVDF